ncbi:MAG TPA: hypothetical protein VJ718_01690 [Candidatus Binataceae bacterium]|jgi:biotin synthase-like enzyme|nr:hypothetical protein [Candidatus Binataceae bacterium]
MPPWSAAPGERELNLGERKGDIFNAVNSIIVNGYLTTAGWSYETTHALIEQAGSAVENGIAQDL